MRIAFIAAILDLCLAALAEKRGTDGVVHVSLTRHNSTAPRRDAKKFHKREDSPTATSDLATAASLSAAATSLSTSYPQNASLEFWEGLRYYLEYEIGGQKLTGILDTGSSDTWVFSKSAGDNNTYEPGVSKNYEWINNDFSEAYGDGSNQVSGSWAKDTVTIGGASVSEYEFAFLNHSSKEFMYNIAIMGISVKNAESAKPKYPPFVAHLKNQGTINANAFSLYLTNEGETDASLLLGGVDTAKADGPFSLVPWYTSGVIGSDYYGVETKVYGQKFQAIWDTGTPELVLPQDLADIIALKYGYVYVPTEQLYVKPGPANMDDKEGLTFYFDGFNVTVPAKDLVYEDLGYMSFLALSLSIFGGTFFLNILGDPIMRNLNIVFDLDNKQYALAPVKYTSESNIQAITSSIPGVQ